MKGGGFGLTWCLGASVVDLGAARVDSCGARGFLLCLGVVANCSQVHPGRLGPNLGNLVGLQIRPPG